MASVSSLDQDMRNLRLSRYTPAASNECRAWIEDTLGEKLPSGDLLESLKDGVALCKLANLVLSPPGIRFKKSSMPFIQMENISHFLRACENPPLNMPSHDRFLTVDLFESKDPAQVLQCLSAFSRAANATSPGRFPTAIGPKRAGALSPTSTGAPSRNGATSPYVTSAKSSTSVPSARPMTPARTGGSTTSSTADGFKSPTGPVSSWTKKGDEGTTSPAWNIHQYGYMGGASQGNQGISFGARRQITSAGPNVPSLADKERKRREKQAEEERLTVEAKEAERKGRMKREAEEENERVAEEQRWEEETRRARDEERRRLEEQKRQWEEQERRWKIEEEARLKEEAEIDRLASQQPQRPRGISDARLRGQYLSQYQAEQVSQPTSTNGKEDTPERTRVAELEKQLEEARERERQYQLEREERMRGGAASQAQPRAIESDVEERPVSSKESEASWAPDEREYLRQQWQSSQTTPVRGTGLGSARPLPSPGPIPIKSVGTPTRPTPAAEATSPSPVEPQQGVFTRRTEPQHAPQDSDHRPTPQAPNRTDHYLAENPPPAASRPVAHQPAEMGYTSTYEQQNDVDRRTAAQDKTKAGGWASKSLLEREMERERERQKEWEASQQATKYAARDVQEGSGAGQSWDVHQYGYTGGDNQNRVGSGIGFGGRRQILGPRPPPK